MCGHSCELCSSTLESKLKDVRSLDSFVAARMDSRNAAGGGGGDSHQDGSPQTAEYFSSLHTSGCT